MNNPQLFIKSPQNNTIILVNESTIDGVPHGTSKTPQHLNISFDNAKMYYMIVVK